MDVISYTKAKKALNLSNSNAAILADIRPVDVKTYGAKLDGVTDDSLAFTNALKDGNIYLPPNSKVYLGNTVQINNPQRFIDFRESALTIADNVIAFQVGSLTMTSSLLNIELKNAFVTLGNSSSFFLSYSSYFIKLTNIRLTGLTGSGYGARIVNGFNVTFNEFHINGVSSGASTKSGNNAIGITVETNTGVNSNVLNTSNITNILVDSCLIQRVQYGIYFNNVGNTVYDTNKINNVGFSYVDYAIHNISSKSYNLQIKLVRCEQSGTLLTNDGQVSIEDIYCYDTTYVFANNTDGWIIVKGMLYHWNPDTTGGYVVNNNDGILSFKDTVYLERNSVGQYVTCTGRVLQRQSPYKTTTVVNTGSSLAIDPFTLNTYDQQAYLDFANITGIEGPEFFLISSNSNNFLLPNGLYQLNNTLTNLMLHCKIVGGKVQIVGEQALMTQLSVAGGITGTAKQAFQVMKTTANLTQFNFNNLGITFLYATTSGITLSNGNSNIVNFSSLNGGSAVDLSTTPLIMVPLMDGSGKGFAIKS